MNIKLIVIAIFLLINGVVHAQTVTSRDVMFSFFSSAPIEDISAVSKSGVSAIGLDSKSVYFKVAIRTFEFEKKLMQEHFNENYLESSKYPFAEFKGKIKEDVNFSADGTYSVIAEGDLTIHNVTKSYRVKGELKVARGEILVHTVFPVKLVDHQIKIPRLLIKNIAEVVQVTVEAKYKPIPE